MKPFALALAALLLLAVPAQAQRLTGGGCITIGATCVQFGASGGGASFEARLTTDTISRAAVGLNTSDVPRFSMGPGGASNRDLFLERAGAANLRLGTGDAAAPVAQTLSVQGVVAGTTDTAGAGLTLISGASTGTGQGGSILLQTTPGTTTGSSQNPPVTALAISGAGGVGVGSGVTAASLLGTFYATGSSATAYASNTISTGTRSYLVNTDTTANNMMRLVFASSDTSGTIRNAASITAVVTAHAVSNVTSDLSFQTTSVGTAAEKMRIMSSGNVGIGNFSVNSPQALLQIGSTAATARIYNVFTDASNGEWSYMGGYGPTANVATYGTDKNGTGTTRNVQIMVGGTVKLNYGITTAGVWASSDPVRLSTGYTVAGLPASPGAGARAYVTDQLTACAGVGVALTGGGAVTCPAFFNGTIWTGG